ncbi:hypothetical protein BDFB_003435, partial [Asbolus verrucosus]
MSNICKIRLFYMATGFSSLMVVFVLGGQGLIDESSVIFHIVMKWPWYQWSSKNKKMLLIFTTNIVQPIRFRFAGTSLDYGLAFN